MCTQIYWFCQVFIIIIIIIIIVIIIVIIIIIKNTITYINQTIRHIK